MPEVTFETVKPWTIASFRGTTLTDSQLIERASMEIVDRINTLPLRAMVLINFEDVEFVSSQIIGLLLKVKAKVTDKAGTLKLCHVSPKIREALQITGLLGQFTLVDSESSVVGSRKRIASTRAPAEVGWLH